MYRPQFAYATPDGYQDQDFTYSFDFSNTTLLATPVTGAAFAIQNIILPLQTDEVFLWRGWKVISSTIAPMPLYIQWRDPSGNYLSLCPVPIAHIALPSGAFAWGFATVPIEPEIACPAGSNVLVNISSPTAFAPPINLPRVVLYGVKRGPDTSGNGGPG